MNVKKFNDDGTFTWVKATAEQEQEKVRKDFTWACRKVNKWDNPIHSLMKIVRVLGVDEALAIYDEVQAQKKEWWAQKNAEARKLRNLQKDVATGRYLFD